MLGRPNTRSASPRSRNLALPASPSGAVCAALGKRHPNQDVVLQLTERNYRQLLAERDDFTPHGVEVTDLTSLPAGSDD